MTKPVYDPWNPATWPREHIFWLCFFLASAALVWFTPLNVLDQYPQLLPFTDFMASWNTQIRRVGEISGPANQANKFCTSVYWCLMPILWIRLLVAAVKANPKGEFPVDYHLQVLMFIPLTTFLYFVMWDISDPDLRSNRIGRFILINPLGRSFTMPFSAYIIGIFVFSCIWVIQAILRGKVVIKGRKFHG